jgi:hypothetical protein
VAIQRAPSDHRKPADIAQLVCVDAEESRQERAAATAVELLRADIRGRGARPLSVRPRSRLGGTPGRLRRGALSSSVLASLIFAQAAGVDVAYVIGAYVGLASLGWLPIFTGPYSRDGSGRHD